MQDFQIIFYKTFDGKSPVEEFLDGLDTKMRAKILMSVRFVKQYGYNSREPYSKFLDDGIFELRAITGSDISRVLYFFTVGQKIVLTNGFIKKTQKTPKGEIERAKRYRADYLEREADGNER